MSQDAREAALLDLVDRVVGRASRSSYDWIRALCENRHEVYQKFGLGDREQQAVESLDVEVVATLLGEQMRHALAAAWQGRSLLPEPDRTDIDSAGEPQPRLLLNLIADLARSPDTRQTFLTDRTQVINRYALSPLSVEIATKMTSGDVDRVCDAARTEFIEAARCGKVHILYANLQSFPGPWIDNFSPDSCEAGTPSVDVIIEGRGFALGNKLMVGLVERRMGAWSSRVVSCKEARISQMIPGYCLEAVLPDLRRRLEQKGQDWDRICAEKEKLFANVCIEDGVRHTCPPTISPARLRLGTLQLSERFNPRSSAMRFRISAKLDLRGISHGEYDLWVAYCDTDRCDEGRAAVGPTAFRVKAAKGAPTVAPAAS